MKHFSRFKVILVGVLVISFFLGSYLGYLAALVDIDQLRYIEQVKALTDRGRLEKQLDRAKSILDARRRAYLRRSQEFIVSQRELLDTSSLDESAESSVEKNELIIDRLGSLLADESPFLAEIAGLKEESFDLDFFEDEVDTLEQLLARDFSDDELALVFSGRLEPRRISDALRRLFQLLDKRRQLANDRSLALEKYSFWERNVMSAPSGVDISVYNKGSGTILLNPVHVTQISTALSIMPQNFDSRLDRLYVVYGDPEMRRGMSGLGVVFMKGEEGDFFRVLVHEFGHVYDLFREVASGEKSDFYDGEYRLYANDPSVKYYQLSWSNNFTRTFELPSFASSYGTSDPFEDFAEAYALYVLQGNTFRSWMRDDAVLKQKYDSLYAAFDHRIYASPETFLVRPYDVTMMPVNYDYLLAVEEGSRNFEF